MEDVPPHDDFKMEARVARFEQVLRKWLKQGWTPERNSHPLPYWGTDERFYALLCEAFASIERDMGFRAVMPLRRSWATMRVSFEQVRQSPAA